MSRDVIIETRNLTKVYRDFWGRPKVQALKALDLQVQRGEIFGVLGPNGSGKTTTIKLLLGLLFPTEGDAFIFGEPTTNVAKNERIGYLPEESYLYKFLNAEETLHFYGRLFKMSKAERTKRVGRLIDMVGPQRRQASPAPRVFQGDAAPDRPGPGADQQPRADPPRRADLGPRPDRHRRDQGADPRPQGAGQDGRPVRPPPGRHAGHLRPDRDPAPGRAEGAGQGVRPAHRPGHHPDQDARPARGGDPGDPGRHQAARVGAAVGRPPDDDARRVVPPDRPRERPPPRPPPGRRQAGRRPSSPPAPPDELAGRPAKSDPPLRPPDRSILEPTPALDRRGGHFALLARSHPDPVILLLPVGDRGVPPRCSCDPIFPSLPGVPPARAYFNGCSSSASPGVSTRHLGRPDHLVQGGRPVRPARLAHVLGRSRPSGPATRPGPTGSTSPPWSPSAGRSPRSSSTSCRRPGR